MSGLSVDEVITRVHHDEWARVVARLARRSGDLDVAGWLATTAIRKAIDLYRREPQRDAEHQVDLTEEATRLGRLLHTLVPDEGEVAGLLALMLFTDGRRSARVSPTGELVTLDEQDRSS